MSLETRPDLVWAACPVCTDDRTEPRCTKRGFTIVVCRTCGLRYVNPRPTPEWLDAWYRHEYYEQGRADAAGAEHLVHRDMKLATAHLRLELLRAYRPAGRLVDVGSGGGFLVRAAGEAGWRAVGLEPSESASRSAVREEHIQVVTGRLQAAPLAPGRFDAVTMLDVLEHVLDPRAFLREARRLLVPGGLLLVETPNIAGCVPALMGARHPWICPPEHLTYFTPGTLRRVIEESGFRVRVLQSRSMKVLTVEYILALMARTTPLLAAVGRGTVGRWRGLASHPVKLPLDLLIAVAEA